MYWCDLWSQKFALTSSLILVFSTLYFNSDPSNPPRTLTPFILFYCLLSQLFLLITVKLDYKPHTIDVFISHIFLMFVCLSVTLDLTALDCKAQNHRQSHLFDRACSLGLVCLRHWRDLSACVCPLWLPLLMVHDINQPECDPSDVITFFKNIVCDCKTRGPGFRQTLW